MSQINKMSKVIMASTTAALLLIGGNISLQQASAANGTPNYEVKFNLNPSIVVDSRHNLISSVRSQFSTGSKSYRVQYMDTAKGALDAQGWSDRIRKKSSDSTHQLQLWNDTHQPLQRQIQQYHLYQRD
ncbi:hypothetical protein LJR056_004408 [Paenibacillus sp. LjRoot56]